MDDRLVKYLHDILQAIDEIEIATSQRGSNYKIKNGDREYHKCSGYC